MASEVNTKMKQFRGDFNFFNYFETWNFWPRTV